jgi:hypothetical protein
VARIFCRVWLQLSFVADCSNNPPFPWGHSGSEHLRAFSSTAAQWAHHFFYFGPPEQNHQDKEQKQNMLVQRGP